MLKYRPSKGFPFSQIYFLYFSLLTNNEKKMETDFIIDITWKYYSIILRIGEKNRLLFRLIKEYIPVAND